MLMSASQVKDKILSGATLYLAGEEQLLASLPRGNWIAGTIPYFMDAAGGRTSRDSVFVKEQSSSIVGVDIRHYGVDALAGIVTDSPDNGFSVVIIPGMSKAHARYAQEAPEYAGLFMKQIIGWVAGIHLDDLGKASPKVFDGRTGTMFTDGAVVLHATLAAGKQASIGIVNPFVQGNGDALRFEDEGFSVSTVLVNGVKTSFAEYLKRNAIDSHLPLVADYHGEMINVSIQAVDAIADKVDLYAPVFKGVTYRVASSVPDYVNAFVSKLPEGVAQPEFSCNCVLNYLYSELEGKKTGNLTGPMTFGEIAYQLLNQTLVYLQVT